MERQKREQPSSGNDDRRRAPRIDANKLGSVITRVIGGGEVKLLDFSRSGVLIESDARLAIGAKATIRLTTTDASLTVRGEVVRSKVAGVNGTIVYHTALALDDDLTALEKAVPVAAPKPVKEPEDAKKAASAPATSTDPDDGSEHAYSMDLDSGVEAPVDPILEFLATVPHDLAELRRRAAVNNW
jgi:PilZ domain